MTCTLTHRVYIDGVFSGYQMQSSDGQTRLLMQSRLYEVRNGTYVLTNARCIRRKPEFRWETYGKLALQGINCKPEVYCETHYQCSTCANRDVPGLCPRCIQLRNFCWYKKRRRESQ